MCAVQLSSYLGLIRILNHNMTYYSFLRDFTVVITSEMLLMLASVREFLCRLDGIGKEHHFQSKSWVKCVSVLHTMGLLYELCRIVNCYNRVAVYVRIYRHSI